MGLEGVDPNVALTSLLVAVPATIAAYASLRNGRNMRTNHGRKAGEYLELTHAKVEELDDKLVDLTEAFVAHQADDRREFRAIRDTLQDQDDREPG